MKNKSVKVLIGTLLILAIPFILRFPWSAMDYIFMGVLIGGTGLILNWVAENVNKKYRAIMFIGIVGLAFLVWAEASVGLVEQIVDGSIFKRFN